VAVPAPKISPQLPRVTLTLPLINSSKCVLFLVSLSEEKEDVIRLILKNPEFARKLYPAAMVNPQGVLNWLIAE
jgi:6-phosphogluconolactonase